MKKKIEENSDIWAGTVEIDLLNVDMVVDALKAMRNGNQPEWAKMTLCDCAIKGRFDLLEAATKIIRHEPKELTMHVARYVATHLREEGNNPAKGDVLDVLKAFVPGLISNIPKNKGQLAEWWKRAELDHLPKVSGTAANIPNSVKNALIAISAAHTKKRKI